MNRRRLFWPSVCLGFFVIVFLLWIGFLVFDYRSKSIALGKITHKGPVFLYRDWEIDDMGDLTEVFESPDFSLAAWLVGKNHCTRIKGVKFENCPATEINSALKLLHETLPNLRVLCIRSPYISSDEFEIISKFSELRSLFLKNTNIDDSTIIPDQDIEQLLSLKKLRNLDVRGMQITKHGIELIEKNLTLERLICEEDEPEEKGEK